MKQTARLLCIAILAVMALPARGAAVDAGFGLTTWCAWWEPVWKRMAVSPIPGAVQSTRVTIDPMIFYVPILSLRINERWTLAGLFLYGNGRGRSQSSRITYGSGSGGGNLERSSRFIERYDSDLTVNYSVTGFMKVFAGLKFQGYQIDEDLTGISVERAYAMPYQASNRLYSLSYGAGLGTALTIPLYERLYWTGAVSMLFLWGDERYYRRSGTASVGCNITTGFAYYAAVINTALSLGFRYQLLHYYRHGNGEMRNRLEHVYGVSLSAQYFFNFGARKARVVI